MTELQPPTSPKPWQSPIVDKVMPTSFTDKVIEVIRNIPKGRVMTYGSIAAAVGSPRGARQVVRILHSCAEKEGLPWHRVVNRDGGISLRPGYGYELQMSLLEGEGVEFGAENRIDLHRYLWSPK